MDRFVLISSVCMLVLINVEASWSATKAVCPASVQGKSRSVLMRQAADIPFAAQCSTPHSMEVSGGDRASLLQQRVQSYSGSIEPEMEADTASPTYILSKGPGVDYCANAGMISESSSSGQEKCQERCTAVPTCKYISLWATGGVNWCRLSTKCDVFSKNWGHAISIYHKQSAQAPALTYELHKGPGINYCTEAGMIRQSASAGQGNCQERCTADPDCQYISIWATGGVNWCRLSKTCDVFRVQYGHTISIYRKQSPTTTMAMTTMPTVTATMPVATTATTTMRMTTTEFCEDDPDGVFGVKCAELPDDMDYCTEDTVRKHCPKTCDACPGVVKTTIAVTTMSTTGGLTAATTATTTIATITTAKPVPASTATTTEAGLVTATTTTGAGLVTGTTISASLPTTTGAGWLDGGCTAKLARFDKIHNQDLSGSVGNDPFFPPTITSIAAPGAKCGDSARGISESCDKYNHWKTFQKVASQSNKKYDIIGASGITFDDIDQGNLGNCYFLAALAAVAITHPEIIKDMFLETNLWKQNIFKTVWLLNGKESVLVVDNKIPAGDSDTFFTNVPATGEFWPIILAKTWAKIFGNFKVIEGGLSHEVIKAMTRSPGQFIKMQGQTEDAIWQKVLDGATNKFPMSAGTCNSCGNPGQYGLANGHAYAVLGAYTHQQYGNVVKMFNPWAKDNYNGAVPNTPEVNGPKGGVFTMKAAEFFDAFEIVTINYVMNGYKVTSMRVPAGQLISKEVTMSTAGKVWLSMIWSARRLVDPCQYLTPYGFIKVEQSTAKGKQVSTTLKKEFPWDNELVVEFESSAGATYNILALENFGVNSSVFDMVSLTAYAPSAVAFKDGSSSGLDANQAMANEFAPTKAGKACSAITLPNWGVFELNMKKLNRGVPTYWSMDKAEFLYYYDPLSKWLLTKKDFWTKLAAGAENGGHYKRLAKTALPCGCNDDPNGFNGQVPCDECTDKNPSFADVKCTGAQHSAGVRKACPKTCGVCPKPS